MEMILEKVGPYYLHWEVFGSADSFPKAKAQP